MITGFGARLFLSLVALVALSGELPPWKASSRPWTNYRPSAPSVCWWLVWLCLLGGVWLMPATNSALMDTDF